MIKVKLHFSLAGKTDQWKKYISKSRETFTNLDNLNFVKDMIYDHFGNRTIIIINEKTLTNDAVPYPKFFSAGWFVSDGAAPTELVVVSHGSTMALANKSMVDNVKMLDWDKLAKRI